MEQDSQAGPGSRDYLLARASYDYPDGDTPAERDAIRFEDVLRMRRIQRESVANDINVV